MLQQTQVHGSPDFSAPAAEFLRDQIHVSIIFLRQLGGSPVALNNRQCHNLFEDGGVIPAELSADDCLLISLPITWRIPGRESTYGAVEFCGSISVPRARYSRRWARNNMQYAIWAPDFIDFLNAQWGLKLTPVTTHDLITLAKRTSK